MKKFLDKVAKPNVNTYNSSVKPMSWRELRKMPKDKQKKIRKQMKKDFERETMAPVVRPKKPYDPKNPPVVVSFRNVSKIYKLYKNEKARFLSAFSKKVPHKEKRAIDNISFNIKRGEAVAFFGRNGAGKSTILKMITGVSFPTKGRIKVDGRVSALLELTSGFDSQLTGRENIYLKGQLMGLSKEEIQALEHDIVEFSELGDYIDQPIRTYSSGMKARLGFAVNSNINPEIFIVDEALSVGDVAFRKKCVKKVKEIVEKDGVTLLFVTHSTETAKSFCDRGIVLQNGGIVLDDDIEVAVKKYIEINEAIRKKTPKTKTIAASVAESRAVAETDKKAAGQAKSASAKTEAKEAAKTEAKAPAPKTETAKAEPSKTPAAKAETAKAPAKTEAKTDPGKATVAKAETTKTETTKPPAKAKAKTETAETKAASKTEKAETKAGPTKAQPAKAEEAKDIPSKAQPASTKQEVASKDDQEKASIAKTEESKASPAKTENKVESKTSTPKTEERKTEARKTKETEPSKSQTDRSTDEKTGPGQTSAKAGRLGSGLQGGKAAPARVEAKPFVATESKKETENKQETEGKKETEKSQAESTKPDLSKSTPKPEQAKTASKAASKTEETSEGKAGGAEDKQTKSASTSKTASAATRTSSRTESSSKDSKKEGAQGARTTRRSKEPPSIVAKPTVVEKPVFDDEKPKEKKKEEKIDPILAKPTTPEGAELARTLSSAKVGRDNNTNKKETVDKTKTDK